MASSALDEAKAQEFLKQKEESDAKVLEVLREKVSGLRQKLDAASLELAKSTEEFRMAVRKAPVSDLTSSYLAFASAHMRLAAATSSETSRTARTDVRIVRAKTLQEEEVRREEQKKVAKAKRQAPAVYPLPPDDPSFEELYGEVIDAE